MTGKKKVKSKPGVGAPATFLLSSSPSYSMANTSPCSSGTTTTTVNKTPVLTTTSGGSNNNNNIQKTSLLDNKSGSNYCKTAKDKTNCKVDVERVNYFDSISSINQRLGEDGTDSSAFDFEELSAILNGKSTDINSCFANTNLVKSKSSPNQRNMTQIKDEVNSSRSQNPNNFQCNRNVEVSKDKSQSKKNKLKKADSKKDTSSELWDSGSNEDDDDVLFPKIVKVCSLAANATNAAANLLSRNNAKNNSSTKNDEFDTPFLKRMQYSLLNDVSPSVGNGSNNSISIDDDLDDNDDGDDAICPDYSNQAHCYNLENAGHFLTGGCGLDSLDFSPTSGAFNSIESVNSQLPPLNDCTSIFDGLMNMCEISTCAKQATKKCSLCKSAFYCSESHQRIDWRKHKDDCAPYKLERIGQSSEGTISAMVATRNIEEGKLIFKEKPLLVLPLAQPGSLLGHVMDACCIRNGGGSVASEACIDLKPACLGCLKTFDLKTCCFCSKCGLPLCSKNCSYSLEHNLECNAIERCGTSCEESVNNCIHCLYLDVEILRALQLGSCQTAHGEWEAFISLKNHMRVESYKNTEHFHNFTKYLKTLVPYSAKVSGCNYDLVADCHAIITALGFKPTCKNTFKLIFGNQLLFLHDCIPNTFHFVENLSTGSQHKMTLITKAAISIMKGEPITIDFLPNPFLCYKPRRKVLKNLSIDCRCVRCIQPFLKGDHSGDIKCPNCKDGIVTAETPKEWAASVWSCHICQEEYPYSNVLKLEDECNGMLNKIPKTRQGLGALMEFIESRERQLHPTHAIIIRAWSFVEKITRKNIEAVREPNYLKKYDAETMRDFKLLAKHCDVVTYHLESMRNGLWVDKGIVLFQKFYANFALASRDFQTKKMIRRDYIQRVLQALKALQAALKHLIAFYEGSVIPTYESKLIQDGTHALSTLKEFVQHLMVKDAAESTSPFRLTPSTNL